MTIDVWTSVCTTGPSLPETSKLMFPVLAGWPSTRVATGQGTPSVLAVQLETPEKVKSSRVVCGTSISIYEPRTATGSVDFLGPKRAVLATESDSGGSEAWLFFT